MSDRTKSEQIMALFEQGKSSVEIISMGFAPGTTYGAQRKFRASAKHEKASDFRELSSSRPKPKKGSTIDELNDALQPTSLEDDPEILELQKRIRLAELERRLGELKGPLPELDIEEIERKVTQLWEGTDGGDIAGLFLTYLENADQMVLSACIGGLEQAHKCGECDADGEVVLQVRCTKCGTKGDLSY